MKIKDTNTKAFDKLIKDAMKHLQNFKADIRKDERKRCLLNLQRVKIQAVTLTSIRTIIPHVNSAI